MNVLKNIGKMNAKKPWISILIVLIITVFSIVSIAVEMDDSQGFETSDFMPDNEVSNAQIEISDTFTTSYSVNLLVKSKNSDVITQQTFIDILNVEKAFYDNDNISQFMVSPSNPSLSALSPVDIVVSYMIASADVQELMQNMTIAVNGINMTLQQLSSINEQSINVMVGMNGTTNGTLKSYLNQSEMYAELQNVALRNITIALGNTDMSDMTSLAELFSNIGMNIGYFHSYSLMISSLIPKMMEVSNVSENASLSILSNYTSQEINITTSILTSLSAPSTTVSTYYTYQQMIDFMNNTNTTVLKSSIYNMINSNATPIQIKAMLPQFFTTDFNSSVREPSAIGMMILYNFNKSKVISNTSAVIPVNATTALNLENNMASTADNIKCNDAIISVMGSAIISDKISDASMSTLQNLIPVALAMIIVILIIVYRELIDTVISLLALIIAIIWLYGIGTAFGFSFNPITTAIPILIIGLGIDYGIHITMRYREERRHGNDIDGSNVNVLESVGEALMLATLTTIIAFLSNLTSSMSMMRDFGILASIGILSSFVVMILLVPSVITLRDRKREKKGIKPRYYVSESKSTKLLDSTIGAGGTAANKHPVSVIVVTLIITAGMGYGALNLNTQFDLNDFLPGGLEITKDINFMMDNFGDSIQGDTAYVLIKGNASDPVLIREIEQSITNMNEDQFVKKIGNNSDVESIYSLMYDFATNSSGSGYVDPNYNVTFSQMYSSSFEISDGTGKLKDNASSENIYAMIIWLLQNDYSEASHIFVVNDDGTQSILLKVNMGKNDGDKDVWTYYDELKNDITPLKNNNQNVVVTGNSIVTVVIMKSINDSQMKSLLTTLIASLIILMLLFWYYNKSYSLGIFATLPIVFVVVWMWGIMYFAGIALNVMTLTIASLTVGMGITYGIHITHRFVEDLRKMDHDEAIKESVRNTGTALFGAAITTIAGFGILGFAIMPPLAQFGNITALAILLSFISSVFVLPAMLVLWARITKIDEKSTQNSIKEMQESGTEE